MKNVPTTMKNTLLILALFAFGAFLQSCGGDDDEGTTPTRTVDRSQLTDKDWYRDGRIAFRFDSDGTYNLDGTWEWFATGDSLQVQSPGLGTFELHFDYLETDEMKCGGRLESTRVIYTTNP